MRCLGRRANILGMFDLGRQCTGYAAWNFLSNLDMLYFYIDSEDIQEIYERTMDTLKRALFGVAGDVIETG